MVYTGKPSRGCQTCRTRRIKCDETRPTCKQCTKSQRECPGYRSEFEIIHRDETRATHARVRKQMAKTAAQQKASFGSKHGSTGVGIVVGAGGIGSSFLTKQSSSPTSLESSPQNIPPFSFGRPSSPTTPASSVSLSPPQHHRLLPSPPISVEQQASCYFASNFILVSRAGGTTLGYMEYLLPMLESEPTDSALRHAFNACAVAALGNRRSCSSFDFTGIALREQTRSLAKTYAALRDPKECRTDSTLATILLLILFESITAKQETGLLAWRSHIEGAVQIVTSRGRGQFRTKIGRGLFNAVRQQLIARTLSSGVAPAMGADWWNAENTLDSISSGCQRLSLKTSELRAEATRMMTVLPRTPPNIDLMLEMLRRIQTADRDVANWMQSLTEEYTFRTAYWEEEPLDLGTDNDRNDDKDVFYSKMPVFPGRVDVYPSFMVSSIWNTARVSRLILASLVIRCAAWVCSPVDYRITPEYATARRTCENTIVDIVASVPYHLGWRQRACSPVADLDSPADGLAGFACGATHEDDHAPLKVLPALFIIWPLTCMNSHDCTTEAQRAWAAGRLRYIADELGIEYARILAKNRVRFPSSLIRKDGLMSFPDPLAHKVNKVISTKA